ncbi:MAG: hypothetical protein ACYC96_04215 [Fimbriimonadaceae bacterium]
MHTDHDPIDPKTLAEMGYEQRDVSPKPMAWAAFWLFVFTIGSGLIGALLIKLWNIVPEVPTEQRAFHKVHPPKDTPILQNNSDNTADIATLRRNEALVLTTSGKAADPGFYHIPIDDAIKLITQRGMPVTGTQTVTHPKTPPIAGAGNQGDFTEVPVSPGSASQPVGAPR